VSAPTVTEREAVLRERDAVQRTVVALWDRIKRGDALHNWEGSESLAKRLYPLPLVTRPRVVADPVLGVQFRWCVRAGMLARYDADRTPYVEPTPERVALWADLLANPTEQVEDGEP
jgi:hypothetical protein